MIIRHFRARVSTENTESTCRITTHYAEHRFDCGTGREDRSIAWGTSYNSDKNGITESTHAEIIPRLQLISKLHRVIMEGIACDQSNPCP